jgi:hypothetical protein
MVRDQVSYPHKITGKIIGFLNHTNWIYISIHVKREFCCSSLERGRKAAGSSREMHTMDVIDESITFVRRKKCVPRSLPSGMGMYVCMIKDFNFVGKTLWNLSKAMSY